MTAPEGLSEESCRIWDHATTTYNLDAQHLATLRVALEALDDAAEARRVIREEGLTVSGARGAVVAHPALAILRESRTTFLRGMRQLGLDQYRGARLDAAS